MGRQVRLHVLLVAQSATARAIGGPEMRENFSTRILVRYSLNAWHMPVPAGQPHPDAQPARRPRPSRPPRPRPGDTGAEPVGRRSPTVGDVRRPLPGRDRPGLGEAGHPGGRPRCRVWCPTVLDVGACPSTTTTAGVDLRTASPAVVPSRARTAVGLLGAAAALPVSVWRPETGRRKAVVPPSVRRVALRTGQTGTTLCFYVSVEKSWAGPRVPDRSRQPAQARAAAPPS